MFIHSTLCNNKIFLVNSKCIMPFVIFNHIKFDINYQKENKQKASLKQKINRILGDTPLGEHLQD